MTKYQSSIDGLQRILDEYPGTQHGFDYAMLSEEESKKIIREARDELIRLENTVEAYLDIMTYYDYAIKIGATPQGIKQLLDRMAK